MKPTQAPAKIAEWCRAVANDETPALPGEIHSDPKAYRAMGEIEFAEYLWDHNPKLREFYRDPLTVNSWCILIARLHAALPTREHRRHPTKKMRLAIVERGLAARGLCAHLVKAWDVSPMAFELALTIAARAFEFRALEDTPRRITHRNERTSARKSANGSMLRSKARTTTATKDSDKIRRAVEKEHRSRKYRSLSFRAVCLRIADQKGLSLSKVQRAAAPVRW